MPCIILCVAGGVAVYDAVVCVAVCVAGCVARWCCLCIASAEGWFAGCVAGCVAAGAAQCVAGCVAGFDARWCCLCVAGVAVCAVQCHRCRVCSTVCCNVCCRVCCSAGCSVVPFACVACLAVCVALWCCFHVAGSQLICGQTCAWHIDVEDRHSRCERGASNAGTLALRPGQQM